MQPLPQVAAPEVAAPQVVAQRRELVGFCDSGYVGCDDTRRSTAAPFTIIFDDACHLPRYVCAAMSQPGPGAHAMHGVWQPIQPICAACSLMSP
jgi:hypothetical protein